ncbi:MAG: nucleotidyltransferase family protein, partial [Deltaproteobacteria bacterium]|nr:nucleotidyltransferase family protein [Deltaproteobacteria bacterium]
LYVELHWTPYYEFGGSADVRGALARARHDPERGLSVLDREDELLVLLLHMAHNRFRGVLRSLVDVAFYLHAVGDRLDGPELSRRAKGLGASFAVTSGLRLCRALLGEPARPIPVDLRATITYALLSRLSGLPEAIVPPQALGSFARRLTVDVLLQDGLPRRLRQAVLKTAALTERRTRLHVPDRLVRRGDPPSSHGATRP